MRETIELTLDDSPSRADLDRLREGLTEHAASFVDPQGFQPLAVFARDPEGELASGYEVFACLPDYPPGHSKDYLRKKLDRG